MGERESKEQEAVSIWHETPALEALNEMGRGTLSEHLSIEFVEVGPDYLRATMPVEARTYQPFGQLHGGASVVLAETLGSVGANACVDPETHYCVGIEVNANHLRAVRTGQVTGTARPLHRGRSTQVWEVRIRDNEGQLVAVSRLTLAVLSRP